MSYIEFIPISRTDYPPYYSSIVDMSFSLYFLTWKAFSCMLYHTDKLNNYYCESVPSERLSKALGCNPGGEINVSFNREN